AAQVPVRGRRYRAVAEDPRSLRSADLAASLRVGDNMSSNVRSVPASATLLEIARLLADASISCVVVMDDGRPAGIVSERDIVRELVRDPEAWTSRGGGDVMSHPLHVTDAGASVTQAIAALMRHRVRRLPVVTHEGQLAGIVTQSDLLRAAHRRLE